MRYVRTAFALALTVGIAPLAAPVAAQSTSSDGSRVLITVEQVTAEEAQVLTVPEFGPLITGEASDGVLLEATSGGQGVFLEYQPVGDARVGVAADATRQPPPRPEPRPTNLNVAENVVEVTPEQEEVVVIVVDADTAGPRPAQRPREIAVDAPAALVLPVEEAVQEVVIAAAVLPNPSPAPSLVLEPTVTPSDVRRAPTPTATETVANITPRMPPASRSAVHLPGPLSAARPDVQPAAFAVPRQDRAPVAPGPQSDEPAVQETMDTPQPPAFVTVSAALMPGVSIPPSRVAPVAFTTLPTPDPFPYFALPRGSLPAGPQSQDRTTRPPVQVLERMAAVLLGDPGSAPHPLDPLSLPDMPLADEPPRDPEGDPDLPTPDATALARLVTEAEICWQFADLAADAAWASLSVEVALDEMNMPAAHSIRLTGFSNVMSSSAAEAYHAARGALIACAEATEGAPATAAATLVFDRTGVRLR
ncbi:hypothetical protein [Gymnodinialimonas ulvae]|uniref:hypothetical protein n=1 Tax=Gymnodinialimonas ulvae TaxID=3126504 RepID=UPI0030A46260